MELKRFLYGITNCMNNSFSKKNIYFMKRSKKFIFTYFSIWRHNNSWKILEVFLPLDLELPLLNVLNISSFSNIWLKDHNALFSKHSVCVQDIWGWWKYIIYNISKLSPQKFKISTLVPWMNTEKCLWLWI